MSNYDLVIVGLGTMGSAALYHAAKRGLHVLGIDQNSQIPHDHGSHHGHTRIIRQAYFEDPAYVPLVLRAYELWDQLSHDVGEQILVKTGGLMLGAERTEVISGALQSAIQHHLPYEKFTSLEVMKRFPVFSLDQDQVGIYEPEAGYLWTERAIRGHLKEAVRLQASISLAAKMHDWSARDGGHVILHVNGETLTTSKLIITVGAFAKELLPTLPLTVERQVPLWIDAGRSLAHLPIYICDDSDREGVPFYGFPMIEDQGLKIAFHHHGETCTPKTLDRTISQRDINMMRSTLQRRLPSLADRDMLSGSVCMYTNTPDSHFIIGEHPKSSDVILGLGFSGHGFKFAPAIGEWLVKIVCGETNNYVSNIFSPLRWELQL